MTPQFADAVLRCLLIGWTIALGGIVLGHVVVEVVSRAAQRRYELRVARAKHRLGIALTEAERALVDAKTHMQKGGGSS